MAKYLTSALKAEIDELRTELNAANARIAKLEGVKTQHPAPEKLRTREPGSKRAKGQSKWTPEQLRQAAIARGADIDKPKFLATVKSCGLAVYTDLRLKFVEGVGYVDRNWLPKRKSA